MMKRGANGRDNKQQAKRTKPHDGELHISEAEWQAAEEYFDLDNKKSRAPIKMSKPRHNLHSFMRFQDKDIVAFANKNVEGILGEGNFGIVVKGEKRDRSECAIKIEAGRKRPESDPQVKLMQSINYHQGETQRTFPKPKSFKGKKTKSKRYTILAYLPGQELTHLLDELSYEDSFIIAIKICEALKALHHKRIIHLDLKPGNIKVERIDCNYIVNICDYDFSISLPVGQDSIALDYWCGTATYMAPEIGKHLDKSTYSLAADIYALGMLFKNDLNLPREIYASMIYKDRTKRCTIDQVCSKLQDYVSKNIPELLADLGNDDSTTQLSIEPSSKRTKVRSRRA